MEAVETHTRAEPMTEPDSVLDSIEVAYRSSYPRFLHVASAITGDPELAADAVQEAFLRAISRRRSYRGRGSVEAWLWRIVVNAARDAVGRRGDLSTNELAEPGSGSAAAVEMSDLRAAVASLPERQRLTLFLRYFGDLDYRTIAEALDVSPGTVGASLNSAHNSLRSQIEGVEPR